MKDFELAVSELLDQYRNKIPRSLAADDMRRQLALLEADTSWRDGQELDDDGDEDGEPEPEPEGEPPAAA